MSATDTTNATASTPASTSTRGRKSLSKTGTGSKTEPGTSILLRMPPAAAAILRDIAKKEERTITTVALRAFRQYFESEHGVKIDIE